MKPHCLAVAGAFGLILSGYSQEQVSAPGTASPPTRLVEGGWKPSWSPDSRQIVFGRGPGLGLERLNLRSHISAPWISSGKDACWSPNGHWIAFVREESYNSYLTEQVWVMKPEGKEPLRLINGGFPSWSVDGKKLFVHSRQQNTILAVDPEQPGGTPDVFFSNTPAWYFTVSPDEKRIAFGCPGRLEIRQRESGNTLASWPVPRARGLLPAWSPDGKLIAFGGFDGSRTGLWVLDVGAMKAAEIIAGDYTMPSWNYDGSLLAFDSRSGNREVWTVGRSFIEGKMLEAKPAVAPDVLNTPQQPQPDAANATSLVGKAAPDFSLPSLDGSVVSLLQLKGKVVVLDFWATWCPPCRKSLPHLQHVSQDLKLKNKDLRVVAVDLKETRAKVQEFMNRNGYGFLVALDSDGAISEAYLVHGIPTTVIIDRAGVIRNVFVGFGDSSEKLLDSAIDEQL